MVYSASKKDKATGILQEGVDILKKLYNSKNNAIKVRALVVTIIKKRFRKNKIQKLFFYRVSVNWLHVKAVMLVLNY